MFKISHDLKLRLLDKNKARVETHTSPQEMSFHGHTIKVPGVSWSEVILDLKGQPNLFQECEHWMTVRMTRVGSRCDSKLTMGEYEGLWPSICDKQNMRVTFLIDCFHAGRSDWRDWFIQGEEYAPQ